MLTHSHSCSHIVRDECYVVMDVMSYAPPSQIKSLLSHFGGSDSKESAALWETQVWLLCWEDPVEKGMATHSSILAWRIPRTEEPDELHSRCGCKELDTARWLTLWLSHPSFGESCWQTAVTGDTASGFVSIEERKSYLLSRTPPRNDRSKWGQKALALSTHLELWKVIPPSGSTAVVRWDSPLRLGGRGRVGWVLDSSLLLGSFPSLRWS